MEVPGLLVFIIIAINFVDGNLQWSKNYILKAVLTVPEANLSEPYQVWVDGDSRNSRIDFYAGMDKLYRTWDDLAEKYTYYKINPETTGKFVTEDVCHIVSESIPETKAYVLHTYLPVKDFKFVCNEDLNGLSADKYEYVIASRLNTSATSTVWVRFKKMGNGDKIPIPLRYVYEMKTGNNLLEYFCHEYVHFEPSKPDLDVVQKPLGLECTPLMASSFQAVDPLLEYVEPAIGHNRATNAFHRFKEIHNKTYEGVEHNTRLQIFKNNLRFVESENRQHKSYKLGMTYLADLSEEEMQSLILSSYHDVNDSNTMGNDNDNDDNDDDDLDDNDLVEGNKDNGIFDWREYGAVTEIKDQTTLCGSCYAFSTAAAVESSAFIYNGCQNMNEVSEQAILDCTWGERIGNLGCQGGTYEYALKWMIDYGIPAKDKYGPYLALEGKCHVMEMPTMVHISNFTHLPRKKNLIRKALRNNGPLIASLDASPRSFALYIEGVYDDLVCRSEPWKRTHAVTIVGYGKEQDDKEQKEYWLLKNSFGSGWGEDGYMRLTTKDNRCGLKNFVYSLSFSKKGDNSCIKL